MVEWGPTTVAELVRQRTVSAIAALRALVTALTGGCGTGP
jgi:hypothetical protein